MAASSFSLAPHPRTLYSSLSIGMRQLATMVVLDRRVRMGQIHSLGQDTSYIRIGVVDRQGLPVVGAKVNISVFRPSESVIRKTDSAGLVSIRLPVPFETRFDAVIFPPGVVQAEETITVQGRTGFAEDPHQIFRLQNVSVSPILTTGEIVGSLFGFSLIAAGIFTKGESLGFILGGLGMSVASASVFSSINRM